MALREIYQKQEDGSLKLIHSEEMDEVNVLSQEEIIAQKEQDLLNIYQEIQDLKAQQNQ